MSKEMISAIARDFNKNMCSDREVLESCTECAGSIENSPCPLYEIATRIYNAGYRKQSEGEWKQTTEPLGAHDVDCVECSVCGEIWVLDEDFDYDVVKDFWNFCPNCGAHMRKEDEGK